MLPSFEEEAHRARKSDRLELVFYTFPYHFDGMQGRWQATGGAKA
jgi:hypothetical protein